MLSIDYTEFGALGGVFAGRRGMYDLDAPRYDVSMK